MDNHQELTLVQPSFSLTEQASLSLLQAAINKAAELGIKATVSVVDASGRQLAFLKMAGSFLVSSELARKKAITAAGMGLNTVDLENVLASAPPRVLEGLNQAGDFTVIGGGVPLYRNGILVGGVGVSGGSEDEDIECARFAAQVLAS
ncbi:GlcG/HbpS family heme-binding protein [Marinobacter sp. NSM]|uniref:GlcG/HbpS family heme-binding protein n=1 Tax=Marinobacter sp. NSM TaxID=3458004 RepID=UPI00403574C4